MERIKEDIKLCAKLTAYLNCELTNEERTAFEKIIENDRELKQYLSQHNKAEYLDDFLFSRKEIDINSKWKEHIEKRKPKSKLRNLIVPLLSGVASILLLCGIGWNIYNFMAKKPQTKVIADLIIPGSSKAKLIVETGSEYLLQEMKTQTITEDGATIKKSGEELNYHVTHQTKNNAAIAPMHTIVVPKGGEHQITLSDGTHIWINSESKLTYPAWFNGNTREVKLVGEAYFDVAHNAEMPFVVSTKKSNLEVLGTEFNVSAYADENREATTLVEGKVKVTSVCASAEFSILTPGMQSVIEQELRVAKVDTRKYIAWKNGEFVFRKEPLEEIFTRLERWYDFEVFFANEKIKHYSFSGTTKRSEGIDKVLSLLEKTTHIHFEIQGKAIIVRENSTSVSPYQNPN